MFQELGLSWENRSSPMFEMNARIANPPPLLLAKYTRKEREFFFEYASFVLRIIENAKVLDKLRVIFEKETIRIERRVDLRIMVFPARPVRGRPNRMLHGSYSQSSSQISLYPLKLPREWVRTEGLDMFTTPIEDLSTKERRLLLEISRSAVSTLVHEILHVKFESRGLLRYVEEAIVQKLERQYVVEWEDELPGIIETELGRVSR
jgi:hypothetical protein